MTHGQNSTWEWRSPFGHAVVPPGTERDVEWQVTGEPGPIRVRGRDTGERYPSYRFVWRESETPNAGTIAEKFVTSALRVRDDGAVESKWEVGPTLTRRIVYRTPWEHVPTAPEQTP